MRWFVVPVRKNKLEDYRRMAKQAEQGLEGCKRESKPTRARRFHAADAPMHSYMPAKTLAGQIL
jgi:hypothetical protein